MKGITGMREDFRFVGGRLFRYYPGGMNLVELASRIKAARLSKGYTLERVSELSGLAKGLLSKVENFRVTPSLPSLAKICEALGMNMSELFDGLDEKPRISIVRCDQCKRIERDESDIEYLSLAHLRPDRTMDPFVLRIPGHGGRLEPMPHEGEEFLIVLSGRVTLEYNGEMFDMKQGDAAYFDAEVNHRVFNPGVNEAAVLCVFLGRPL